jgi:hypothetical protein
MPPEIARGFAANLAREGPPRNPVLQPRRPQDGVSFFAGLDLLARPVNYRLRLLDREFLAAAGEVLEPGSLGLRAGLRAFLRFPFGILAGIPPVIPVIRVAHH